MHENIEKFVAAFISSLQSGSFARMTVGNYKGDYKGLSKVLIRPIETKKGERLLAVYKYENRDMAKNYAAGEAAELLQSLFSRGFKSGHLFTAENDFQLDIGKRNSRLNVGRPTFSTAPKLAHDREKHRLIPLYRPYLKALGITDDSGRVRDRQQNKWRQINKFVEIIDGLISNSSLKEKKGLRLVDMGSGKGYLTFALFDHLTNSRNIDVELTGIETRSDLVGLCNDIAAACGFGGLKFVESDIASFEIKQIDLLIALHACNTATDDAIYKGITSNAEIIVTAPCCHQELRPQITPPAMLRDVMKHGVIMERTAESLTDGIRSMLLECEGYGTKMIEFVPLEHTPKNNMLVAVRSDKTADTSKLRKRLDELKAAFGISSQRLDDLLTAIRRDRH
ncbi:MAG: SAM-dependent methyltransferase [Acidobacteriota bacterium]|nr:MAG: SAM-dependent methyltransferase [Acidobacteriota bacterium]